LLIEVLVLVLPGEDPSHDSTPMRNRKRKNKSNTSELITLKENVMKAV
jgi:hypothetical protein